MLLPALDEWPERQEYEPGRRLEYVVAMQAGLSLLSAALLLAMLACLVVGLRWRFHRSGAAIPILLLPDWRGTLRILVVGVLLPLAVYAAVVWLVPISGQCYSVKTALHKILIEFALLTTVLLLLPTWLAVRVARKRCTELGIPTGRAWPWLPLPVLVVSLVAAGLWCVPPAVHTPFVAGITAAGAVAPGAVIVVLLLTGVVAALRLLIADSRHGLCLGTIARSLIPVFAAALIALCLTARPVLLGAERQYLASDTILLPEPNEAGFSRIENQLTGRLRQAVEEAAAELENLGSARP